ncbi:hypothetical protein ACLKA7_007296 [Drosophila subpalustris]
MRSNLAECLLSAFCFKQHPQDDEQTFADQLEQQASSHGIAVIQIEQPEPETHRVQMELERKRERKRERERDFDRELAKETLRTESCNTNSNPNGATERGSHSPARLEEISICADVHQSIKPTATDLPRPESMANNERYSGVRIKDEIEIFTDVELGNGAHYFIF